MTKKEIILEVLGTVWLFGMFYFMTIGVFCL
jgi:hypothetical protein